MMTFGTGKKKFAEVFTSPSTVFYMCLNEDVRQCVQNVDKTILDPACGEGKFPCAELVLKMFYNLDKLDEALALRALQSLYGIDIQEASVAKTREHLKKTLQEAFFYFTGKNFPLSAKVDEILEKNFIVGDFLKGGDLKCQRNLC